MQSGTGFSATRAIYQRIVHLSAMGNLMLVYLKLHSFLFIYLKFVVIYSINRPTNCTSDPHHCVFVVKYKIYVIFQFGVCRSFQLHLFSICSVYYTSCFTMFKIRYICVCMCTPYTFLHELFLGNLRNTGSSLCTTDCLVETGTCCLQQRQQFTARRWRRQCRIFPAMQH